MTALGEALLLRGLGGLGSLTPRPGGRIIRAAMGFASHRRLCVHTARGAAAGALAILAGCAGPAMAGLLALRAEGCNFVDLAGCLMALRGTNLGGGFVYEQWMTQVAGPRAALELWALLDGRFGRDRRRRLQRLWQEAWVGDDDIAACAALGMTCVRLPFGYWVVEEPDEPGVWRDEGFAQLDRVVRACERYGLYIILDLHGAPGGQSKSHTCGVVGKNEFWRPENVERTARLWQEIARRFRGRAAVAGYDLLNEPSGAPSREALLAAYDRLYRAIRQADPDHTIIMEDGFRGLAILPPPSRRRWRNVAYSIHFYPFGFRSDARHRALLRCLQAERRYQIEKLNVPVLVGEFSAVSTQNGGTRWYRRYIETLNGMGWGWLTWCWKHPCRGRSQDVWGIVNQPLGGTWRPPDFYHDSFEELSRCLERLRLEHWDYSPLVLPVVLEGLSAEFVFIKPSSRR